MVSSPPDGAADEGKAFPLLRAIFALFIACSVFICQLLQKYMFLHYETNKVWKHDPSVAKHAEAKGYISD
jgi:hypothetical protein